MSATYQLRVSHMSATCQSRVSHMSATFQQNERRSTFPRAVPGCHSNSRTCCQGRQHRYAASQVYDTLCKTVLTSQSWTYTDKTLPLQMTPSRA